MADDDRSHVTRRSLVGLGAVGVMAGIAHALAAPPTEARADDVELRRRIGELGVYVSSENFPNLFPDGSQDSTAGLIAAIATVPEHGTAIIAPGRYLVSAPINNRRLNLRLVGFGATLVQIAKAPVISAAASWGTPFAVSSISTAEQPTNNPGSSETSPTSKITTAVTAGFRDGDLVKVLSDDVIEEARSGGATASRLGEYAVIKRGNFRTIYTVGPLRERYTTGIRIVAVPRDSLEIRGFTLETADAGFATPGGFGPLVNLIGLHRPVVSDVRCTRSSGTILYFAGCYGYVAQRLDLGYGANDTSTSPSSLGYGVSDNACSFGVVRDSTMRYLRHAYTDDTQRIAVGSSEVWKHGRTYGTKIVDCHSLGSSSDAFDTHHASENVQFLGCSASSGGAGAAGFGLRGKGHVIANARVDAMDFGVEVFTEGSSGGDSYGHVISDAVLSRISKTAVLVSIRPSGHPQAGVRDARANATIDGITITDSRWGVDVINASVDLRDVRMRFGAGAAGVTYAAVRNRNSAIVVDGGEIDMRQNSAGSVLFVQSLETAGQPDANRTTLRELTVRLTDDVAARADRFLVGSRHRVVLRNVELERPFRVVPGTFEPESSLHWRVAHDPANARTDLSSAFQYYDGDLTRAFPELWAADEPVRMVHLQTGSAQHLLGPMGAGRVRGQQLVLVSLGAGSIVIQHGGTSRVRTLTGSQLELGRDQMAAFVWDGASWRQMH